jgi:hypothetical protein
MKKKTKNKEVSKIAENIKRLKKEKGFSKRDVAPHLDIILSR